MSAGVQIEERAPSRVPEPPAQGSRRDWLPFRGWGWREFLFFIGLPAVIGLYAALNNWAVIELAGYETTLLFYAGHSFVPWWTSALMTHLVMRALRPWRPAPYVIWISGSLLACAIIAPYSEWLTQYFAAGWFENDTDGSRAATHILTQVGFWAFTLRATVVWLISNYVFDRWLGLPRNRYDTPLPARRATDLEPAAAPAEAAAETADDSGLRFLQRLPATVAPEQVLALKAEQHYIKVYTADRSFMTLYRFSDACAEMDPAAGQQVHRSYWVRTDAIKAVRRHDGKYGLQLSCGLEVPVSASNRGLVRELARSHNIPFVPPL